VTGNVLGHSYIALDGERAAFIKFIWLFFFGFLAIYIIIMNYS